MAAIKYQVFISSTYTDLIDERDSIIKAILEMYHIPIGMEMFSAEDEDQWEIIRRTIEVSDYYILILGLRYGSKTTEMISFTQKEYEYALEKNIPILAFIMDENVSLPKEKRDDNLTEINTFRATVLRNSKMAQYWKTKDELIKNVSISLMKQIMQKPGIGWTRGNNAILEEALSKEVANLSKENRELRLEIKELESKISPKAPKIDVSVNDIELNSPFKPYTDTILPTKISLDDAPHYLRDYISSADIEGYNNSLPSQDELELYNIKMNFFYNHKNFSSPLTIDVINLGNVKATNMYIDITFPNDLIIIDSNKKIEEPKNPIHPSPIELAESDLNFGGLIPKHVRDILDATSPYSGVLGATFPKIYEPIKISPINQSWSTNVTENKLTIKIKNLLHTRNMKFDDEYVIVPMKSGVFDIEIKVICEELEQPEVKIIKINVPKED